MRKFPKVSRGAIGLAVLVAVAGPGVAQGVGEAQALARMGQALDFSAPVRLAPGEGAECVAANVLHGDRVLLPGQVRVDVRGQGEQRTLRVRGRVPIDEPVVYVVVRLGCSATVTRRFSLLPEAPMNQVAQASAVAAATAPAPAPAPAVAAPPARERRAKAAPPVREARKPRPVLRMEPLDLSDLAPADPTLRLSLSTTLTLGEAARTAAQVRSTREELATLSQETRRVQATLAALEARVRAQEEAFDWRPWVAAGLGVALLAAVAALLRTRSRVRPAPIGRREPVSQSFAPAPAPVPAAPAPVALDVGLPWIDEAPGLRLVDVDVPVAPRPKATAVLPSAAARVEQLLHALHEAEFLRLLGQNARAIDTLQRYVASAPLPAPVAFLAWMELCEAAGDNAALEAAAALCAETYACEPPAQILLDPAWGLERHAMATARVVEAWDQPHFTEVVAQLLFERPGADHELSLQAGRDLLFLHELAHTRAELGEPRSTHEDVWVVSHPHGFSESSWIGFDVDLDALERAPASTPKRTGPATLV